MTRVTRVLIVDDHPVFREGLAGLLATIEGVEVAGSVGTAESALDFCATVQPDVVLMDVNLPGVSGVAATAELVKRAPAPAVLMITMVDDDETVLAALAAGARGYLLKDATPEDIHAALLTVVSGGAVLGAGVAGRLLTERRSHHGAGDDLTGREREVLDLLARGRTNPQIARTLGISLKTVQNIVSRVLDKLQVADRTQAALKARHGHTDRD